MDKLRMEIPYFQTPNDIFDLDIEVIAYQRKKEKGCKEIKKIKRLMRSHEKLIYIYLCRCGNNGSDIFPSYKKIAKKCGISESTAKETIKTLLINNLIVKENRYKTTEKKLNDSNIYGILSPKQATCFSGVVCQATEGSVPGEQGVVCQATEGSVPGEPKKELYKKNYIKKELYKKEDKEEGVSEIIEIFDNNVHMITAIEQETLLSYLENVTADVIVEAIKTAVKYNARSVRYIERILQNWIDNRVKDKTSLECYLREQQDKKNKSKDKKKVGNSTWSDYGSTYAEDNNIAELEKKLLGWE